MMIFVGGDFGRSGGNLLKEARELGGVDNEGILELFVKSRLEGLDGSVDGLGELSDDLQLGFKKWKGIP